MDTRWRRAGQVLCVGYEGTEALGPVREALAADALGGVVLFSRNLRAPEAIAEQIASLARAAAGPAPLVAVDQEGGRVERLKGPVLSLPPARGFGLHDDPSLTRQAAAALGKQLGALGFNVDFAPVLDVDSNPANPVIGDRSFGSTPDVVIRHGRAFAAGLAEAGLLACGKHYPGHGDTDVDSHHALPTVHHDEARLEAVELAPFLALVPMLPAVMTAHVMFPALDPDRPATLSPVIVGRLREAGFDGLLVSDDLEMRAVADSAPIPELAVAAIGAGCDLLLVCRRTDEAWAAREAIANEARRSEAFAARLDEAAQRVDAARRRLRCRPVTDREELMAALHEPVLDGFGAKLSDLVERIEQV